MDIIHGGDFDALELQEVLLVLNYDILAHRELIFEVVFVRLVGLPLLLEHIGVVREQVLDQVHSVHENREC